MHDKHTPDWFNETSGKDNRPNDLDYWIGYEILRAYFTKLNPIHKKP